MTTARRPEIAPVPRRTGRRRDRRGRGARGADVLPGPLTPYGVPRDLTRREAFDRLVLEAVHELEDRWHEELGLVEFAVEEAPLVPDDWAAPTVPLATLVRGSGGAPTRLVVFRRPIELRAETPADLSALVLTVLVEQVSELLGRPPEEIDPRYDADA
ncbi:MAG TPA: metallopeptidase family protein [Nocardioides sp.]|nr:metallopeptidase family protein [Nocardioides sp.]